MAKITDFVWPIWALLSLYINFATGLSGRSACSNVKTAYNAKGYSTHSVPENAISGQHLSICSQDYTCCTAEMETQLADTSVDEFEDHIDKLTSYLRDFFVTRTDRYDQEMKELIVVSQQDLNRLYIRTYGDLYKEHDEFFMDLFSVLRSYYFGIDLDLEQVMEDFFIDLFQKMFVLIEDGYVYTDEFWACTTPFLDELKPFGGVPEKLSSQVKRSFVAARTFAQGLGIARDAVIHLSQIPPSDSCREALMRMSYCPHCKGFTTAKPCHTFCMNVMKGCLSNYAEVEREWKKYIDQMTKLSERLEGSFNIESVMRDIDLQISDAIMALHTTSHLITPKVMLHCGPLPLKPTEEPSNRETRSNHETRSNRETRAGKRGRSKQQHRYPASGTGSHIERLLRDVRKKLNDWSKFWSVLPYTFCDDETWAADTREEHNCWNGQSVGRYQGSIPGDGVAAQVNNPEVSVDQNHLHFIVQKNINQLRMVTNQLSNAYNGKDTTFIDSDEYYSGSGSGSGSGDGMEPDYTVPSEDPKYRPTVTPESGGCSVSVSWMLLFLFLFTTVVFRW